MLTLPSVVAAQQPTANATPAAATSGMIGPDKTTTTPQRDDRYRIGPGDLLEIRVLNRPQLSRDSLRVDGRGMIRMPFIEDEIQAACRTEGELSREIATRYLKYQRNPQVDVFIKEYGSQPVAVIGAVNAPGRFQLQRRVRLLELLTFAGGPSERAGRAVQVVHATDVATICETPDTETSNEVTGLVSYNLTEMLRRGDENSNPYVRAGDIVSIPEAEQIFVVGNVLKPSAISLKESITVSRAVAMAGGTLPDTKSDRVRISRQSPGSTSKTEIFVDLKAIDKRRAEDVVLQPGDIVDVPTSGGKRFLRNIISAIAPAVGQMPVRVIP